MSNRMLSEAATDQLVSVCRTAVGDELRSVTYFTEDTVEQLYLRDDLERSADLVGFADHERSGFHSQAYYCNTQLGSYEATIRMFENGFLTRVIDEGDDDEFSQGVWITTDSMSIDRFEELTVGLRSALEEVRNGIEARQE
ncbi:DUF7522 family protein [Halalkalirubrum salinum]|uniref:DUF7522 family protein n=1 Tax=Halalkalirubrum salinum TaxID=2563889 RepID=UPI0010FB57DB|nr:hypothetical protein [Halalkalirubrum salinum]